MSYKIEERGSSWQATVNHGGRFRRSFKTSQEARRWAVEAYAARLRGEVPDMGERARRDPSKPSTLVTLCEYVIANRWAGQRGGEKSILNARSVVKLLGPDLAIGKVGKFEIDTLVRKLKASGNSDATVNRKLAALSVMFNEALELELIISRPKWKRKAETGSRDQRIDTATEAKIVAFLTTMGEPKLADLWVFCIETGMRLAEARAARWVWLGGNNSITVPAWIAKSKKARVIPLTAKAKAIVDRNTYPVGQWPFFADIRDDHFYRTLDAIRVHLGLVKGTPEWDGFVFHLTRHEFCSRLADRGVPAQTIQALAGHASLTTSQRYIKMSAFASEAAIRLLDQPLGVALGHAKSLPQAASNADVDTRVA
jgi:integrase